MKNKTIILILTAVMFTMTSCANNTVGKKSSSESLLNSAPSIQKSDSAEDSNTVKTIPDNLEEIPKEYFSAADDQGKLEELNYTTYESFSYADKS